MFEASFLTRMKVLYLVEISKNLILILSRSQENFVHKVVFYGLQILRNIQWQLNEDNYVRGIRTEG
jgi:hypothetical protein